MMKDFALEWMIGEPYEWNVQVDLPNIQGQRYVVGSEYPGGKEGEEFLFCRNERILVDHTHFVIRVGEQGQYWVQSDTAKLKTFVNSERLSMEPRLLRFGDMVSLEDSEIRHGYVRGRRPIFQVKERIVPAWSGFEIEGAGSDRDNGSEGYKAMNEPDSDDGAIGADCPLNIPLILEKVISYLPVEDLKSVRLVSKMWRDEASKPLQKRGKVSFYFTDYLNPEYSTRVFRYLHEMKGLKMQNLRILFSAKEPYRRTPQQNEPLLSSTGVLMEKKLDDLRKLLKSSHNFSTLILSCELMFPSSEFVPCHLIFQELGEKLVELELTFYRQVFPAPLPQLPILTNLKKFTQHGSLGYALNQGWVSSFVPLFCKSLEHFTCSNNMAEGYLQEFLKHPTPNLKGITLKDEASVKNLSALLKLKTPLTFLDLQYSEACTEREALLESLLLKNSKSLQHLAITIGHDYVSNPRHRNPKVKIMEIKFPSFPKLERLEIEYEHGATVSWETDLDYKKHFPSLRKLTVRSIKPWSNDDPVFNAFFPEKGNLRCETVEEVWVPVLPNPKRHPNWPYEPEVEVASFQPKMDQIRAMFPSAEKMNFLQ